MSSVGEDGIPNRFDYKTAQPRIYQRWLDSGCFHADPKSPKPPFVIVIPPPNVTGALHLGHALNNTLHDVQIRMKRMQGYNALYMPGTDHAGIATQAVVERRLKQEEGKTRHDLGRDKLVERIWAWKDQYEARILGQLQQMGCSCDWERTRFTLDDVCARAVRRTFFDLFAKRWVYRGTRLVNWDTSLQTAVSDDEVNPETVKGHFWHIRYRVLDRQAGEPEFVTVATTRPETLLGDTAVAVHPHPAQALDRARDELLIKVEKAPSKERHALQKQLADLEVRREEMLGGLRQLTEMATQGRMLELPLLGRPIPLICDEWAKPEKGSGCVKITPAHDPNDYEVGQRHQLPMINILLPHGVLNSNAGRYQGNSISAARKLVVADLESAGLLESVEDHEFELPYSDRSKTPIEPFLADQWFVKMEDLAQSAMDAVTDGSVEIIPQRYQKGYLDWLAEKRDWPVSRQLWWGHRIPVWSRACATAAELDDLASALGADADVVAGVAAFQVEYPESRVNSGQQSLGDAHAWIHVCLRDNDADASRLEKLGFAQVEDVLDTWFSSALWPHSTLGWPDKTPEFERFYPTSMLITSRDIITLWVARMVLAGINNTGKPPFRQVFIHPKILDGEGETMSKSLGNGIDPFDVIERFGADGLRFGMTFLTTETQDLRMPVEFECPYCQALIPQTRQNRTLARVKCVKCGREFSTQWAEKPEDVGLPRGAVVSDRFEQARNFCNKLWNASRFALMNLKDFEAAAVGVEQLQLEDRWLLSRLATTTKLVTESLESFRYADATRLVYAFAWDDFCSLYLEMLKDRFADPDKRAVAQRLLAFALDQLLRLLHPTIPFITEEIWSLLNTAAPRRGLRKLEEPWPLLATASWPTFGASQQDPHVEQRFAFFQGVLGAVREIRSRQNIPPKAQVEFHVRCEIEQVELLEPLASYFPRLAGAELLEMGPEVVAPATSAAISLPDAEVFVDLRDFIDVAAEIQRLTKQLEKTRGLIEGKEKKLANASFVQRAPADVVAKERESLEQLKEHVAAMREALGGLQAAS